jgi:hypothetical protein
MNAHRIGRWVKFPWGTVRLPPSSTVLQWVMVLTSLLLLGLGIRWFLLVPRELGAVSDRRKVAASVAEGPSVSDPEPLSVLFGLDKHDRISFVLLSTVLGPSPRAVVQVGGETFHASPGDTIEGAVVDSVGRGVILVRLNGRRIRVTL